MNETRLLGVVEVDTGTLVVGDPSLLLGHQAVGRTGIDYAEVMRANPFEVVALLGGRQVLLISRFGGDGAFPVFGEFEDGELMRLIVEFIEPNESDS